MPCSPQRFLANDRNAIREATLTPSSVLPVANQVLTVPTARDGTAQVLVTGSYTGQEEATYDIQVIDADIDTPVISKPVLTGEGSGTLEDIAATGTVPQEITVELVEAGKPLLAAAIDFEGQTIKARTAGVAGNSIFIDVDQSGLTFTPQSFSLLQELAAGQGGTDTPLRGSEYDYGTKIMGADGQIPADAHRIAFGADTSAIYLQYKRYVDGEWLYYFVPELKRGVPRGAVISFVTGGRTVTVQTGSPAENTYTGIVTLYDLLNAINSDMGSPVIGPLTEVDGVVANDRAPTGQAAQELQTRTDAHCEPSYGTGSTAALGFEATSCEADAGTQLVIATCRAVTAADHPLASVGRTRWELASSTLGALGTIVEAEAFSGDEFGLTIPRRLPYGYDSTVPKGRFTPIGISYAARDDSEPEPPICPASLSLGPAAVDQTITLVYTERPSGACLCANMPAPNLYTECLGIFEGEGGDSVSYSSDAITRIKALHDLSADIIGRCSRYLAGYDFDGVPETTTIVGSSPAGTFTGADSQAFSGGTLSYAGTGTGSMTLPIDAAAKVTGFADVAMPMGDFKAVLGFYQKAIDLIDAVTDGTLKANGYTQWDLALDVLEGDLDVSSLGVLGNRLKTIANGKYEMLVNQAIAYAGINPLGKSDASTVESGDGCWQDFGGDFWDVVGSDKGQYAPAFTNHPYYSSRRATGNDKYFSTKEFAFQINVQCPEQLRYGDTITLGISDAGWPAMYQVGDELILPIVAASPLYLAGGQNASLVQTWNVKSSTLGPLPPYLYDPDSPAPYTDGSPYTLTFLLSPGGIPFAAADRFVFAIEGGHWQWRKNGGAWNLASPPDAIPIGPVSLDAGLSVEFVPGAAPSFVADDTFSFLALQPWAVSNLTAPTVERWEWTGATSTLDIDLGSVQDLDAAAIALHTLPEGTTITLAGGVAGIADWTETLTWREGVIALLFAATRSARYLRLSLGAATGGGIGWLWVGEAFATEKSADVTPHRKYSVSRGEGGLYQRGRFLGKGRGADVAWTEGMLTEDDMLALATMLDWVKVNDDEPLIFVANSTRPDEATLVQVTDDEIEEHDTSDGNRAVAYDRAFDARLSLGAVLQ